MQNTTQTMLRQAFLEQICGGGHVGNLLTGATALSKAAMHQERRHLNTRPLLQGALLYLFLSECLQHGLKDPRNTYGEKC